jgi:hypothetical protein
VNNGTAVGHFGTILRTTNGGTTWVQQTGGTTTGLRSVFLYDSNNGIIVGDNGKVLRTTNGGSTWLEQFSGIQINLHGVSFADPDNGIVVGGSNLTGAKIYKTSNGGQTWTLQFSISSEVLSDVHLADSQTGTAVGWNGTILRTTDAGITWVDQNSNSPSFLSSVFFVNPDIGFTVGDSGTILATIDGGIPVELSSFTASVKGDEVTLNWSTASEINNKGFEIERSNVRRQMSDKLIWENVGFVEGNGTTTGTSNYGFVDEGLAAGIYNYRLKQIDFDGTFSYSGIIEVNVGLPEVFSLEQNYPNPFNPVTKIKYNIPSVTTGQAQSDTRVLLKVYNLLGREAATLVDEFKPAGSYEVEFNASGLSSGIYYYKLYLAGTGKFETRKMILMK